MHNQEFSLQNPQLKLDLVEQEYFKNGFRENFLESLDQVLKIEHIDITKQPTDSEIRYMQMFVDGEMTSDQVDALITKLNFNGDGEKIVCRMLCNGNMAEFNDWRRALKAIKEDLEKAEAGFSNRHVTPEVGKELQDHEKGDHAPAHSLHLNGGLGDNAGFVSRFKLGYVWKLYADGYIMECQPEFVKKLMLEMYDKIVSDYECKLIADFLNKERRLFESKMLQGDIGDSPIVKDAISIITNRGKTLGLSYEKTDRMGRDARKVCEKFQHDAGKIVGKAVIDGDTPELQQKTARFCKNFIEQNNMNADNVVELLLRMFRRKTK